MEKLLERTIDLEKLRRRISRLESGGKRQGSDSPVSSGCEALDELLPEKGFCRGTLVEWLSAGEGAGAGTLALLAAGRACREGGVVAVFDRRREFCPPAAVRLGIQAEQLVVVHADTAADNHWAIDQALRSPAVAAVLAWPERLDDRTFRRWQLAAEEGGCLGMLLRAESARSQPSWADVRLLVGGVKGGDDKGDSPIFVDHGFAAVPAKIGTVPDTNIRLLGGVKGDSPIFADTKIGTVPDTKIGTVPARIGTVPGKRLLRIALLRCRGGNVGSCLDVELDDETYRVHSVDRRRRQLAN